MRRLASICVAVGACVAALGVLGVALGLRPSALPSAMLDVAAFKLVFVAAGGLIAAGAVLGRVARREHIERSKSSNLDEDGFLLPPRMPDIGAQEREPVAERTWRDA